MPYGTGRLEGTEAVRDGDVDLERQHAARRRAGARASRHADTSPGRNTSADRCREAVDGEARLLAEDVDHDEPAARVRRRGRVESRPPRPASGHVVDRCRRHSATRSCFDVAAAMRHPRRRRNSPTRTRPSRTQSGAERDQGHPPSRRWDPPASKLPGTSTTAVAVRTRHAQEVRARGRAARPSARTPAYWSVAYTDDAATTATAAPAAPKRGTSTAAPPTLTTMLMTLTPEVDGLAVGGEQHLRQHDGDGERHDGPGQDAEDPGRPGQVGAEEQPDHQIRSSRRGRARSAASAAARRASRARPPRRTRPDPRRAGARARDTSRGHTPASRCARGRPGEARRCRARRRASSRGSTARRRRRGRRARSPPGSGR